jgi:hypothetical protein
MILGNFVYDPNSGLAGVLFVKEGQCAPRDSDESKIVPDHPQLYGQKVAIHAVNNEGAVLSTRCYAISFLGDSLLWFCHAEIFPQAGAER